MTSLTPLLLAWLAAAPPAWAQDAPPPDGPATAAADEAETGDAAPAGDPAPAAPVLPLDEAIAAWTDALDSTPALVLLQQDGEAGLDSEAAIQARLKLLGNKVFSNREWHGWWQAQAATARGIVAANAALDGLSKAELRALDTPPLSAERTAGMEAWAALADDKVANQEVYFEALQAERDALEDRLTTLLEAQAAAELPELEAIEDPSPYQRRAMRIASLERQIDVQAMKRTQAERRKEFLEAQMAGEQASLAAMKADEALARREAQLSRAQADLPWDALTSTWRGVAKATADKAQQIAADRQHREAVLRGYGVESGLIDSEVAFRAKRIEVVNGELDEVKSREAATVAAVDTARDWLRHRGLRSVLVLAGLALVLAVVGRLITRLVNGLVRIGTKDDSASINRAKTLGGIASSVLRGVAWLVAGLVALEELGVDTAPIIGSVAILGLAVSFGSQNLVRDVVSGFFVLLENQYAVGDLVIINGKGGIVEKVTLRTTTLREPPTGELHILPNGKISTVVNRNRDWNKVKLIVGVGYGSDLGQVRQVIGDIGAAMFAEEKWSELLQEAPRVLAVVDLADSSVNLLVGAKTEPGKHIGAQNELRERILVGLTEAGVDIPYPQMVMHWAGGPEAEVA